MSVTEIVSVIVSVIVTIIASGSAWAAQRSAAKASTLNTHTTSRVEMERDAYERARKFDVETIERQDEEITELREEVRSLKNENKQLWDQIHDLKRQLKGYENE